MKKTVLSLTFFLFLFTACKKDKADCSLSPASLEGVYKLTSVKENSKEIFKTDYDICEQDDTYSFKSGTIKVSDEGTKCTPPTDDEQTYSLSGNSLVVKEDSDSVTYIIQNFTCSAMDFTETYLNTSYVYHFEKQ